MEKVEMIYLPALVKKTEEDIVLFSQDALSGYCLNGVTWNAILGECGLGPSIPNGYSAKLLWHEIQVWAHRLGTACPSCTGCVYAASEQACPGMDGDLVSTWATLGFLPARRSSSALPSPILSAWRPAGRGRAMREVWVRRCGQPFGLCLRGKKQMQVETWERHRYF